MTILEHIAQCWQHEQEPLVWGFLSKNYSPILVGQNLFWRQTCLIQRLKKVVSLIRLEQLSPLNCFAFNFNLHPLF